MPRPRFASLRTHLVLLVLLPVLPMLGLSLYIFVEQRQQAVANAHADALRLARQATPELEELLSGTQGLLAALVQRPQVLRRNSAACTALVKSFISPFFVNLGAATPEGEVFCSALPFSGQVNIAAGTVMERARAARGFAIGEFQVDRVSGKPSIFAVFPVLDEGGRVQAVAFAALDLVWINQIAARVELPPRSILTVLDASGTILARHPDPDPKQWVGVGVGEAPILRAIEANRGEGVAQAQGLDGISRLLGFATVPGTVNAGRIYVVAGIRAAVALAPAERAFAANLIGLSVVGLLALLGAWMTGNVLILRPAGALAAVARRLSAGDLSARTGLPHSNGELNQLARAFDAMAAALQTREAEVDKAEKALRRYTDRLEALHQIDQAILMAQSPEAIAEAALHHISSLIPCRRARLAVFDFEANEARVLATRSIGENPAEAGTRLSLETLGDIKDMLNVLRQGKVHTVDLQALRASSPVIQALLAAGMRHSNVVPLIAQGQLIGSLSLTTDTPEALAPEQVDIAREVADQVAVGIQQAGLREELRRHATELERRVAERTAELDKAKQEADRASQAKSVFLSRMSHELRTPLNAILGFAQLLEMDSLSPEQRESVGHVLKGGRHLLELINEVLDIARIEAGRLAISPEPVSLREVIQESLDMIGPLAAEQDMQLNGHISKTDQYVRADRQRLKQVLLNLLSNAVKYNRKGGIVAVETEELPEDRLRIKVSDNGLGIPPERLERLFTPFERLGAEQTGVEGTGLGLALSKGLTDAMGGTLGVESTVGQGSTFWLEFPRIESPDEQLKRMGHAVPAPAQLEASSKARIVLYVEDNLSNVKLIQRLLAHRPEVRLLPIMQGRLGLDLAREHRPHLILLDLHLPDIPGEEVLRQLREAPETREIPVVIISADATSGQIKRLLAAGAYAYLTKPIDIKKFLDVLDETLKG